MWVLHTSRHALRTVVLSALTITLLLALAPSWAQASWAESSIRYARGAGLLDASAARSGPQTPVTRVQWVRSLSLLDRKRAMRSGTKAQSVRLRRGAALSDVPATSLQAKAVHLGWIRSVDGSFDGKRPVTADEAAVGIMLVLGKRSLVDRFSAQIAASVPGVPADQRSHAAQALVRHLGFRYNHPAGSESLEVGPTESMTLGHVAYMLRAASTVPSWRMSSLKSFESFSLPALAPNQLKFLQAGVSLIGHPYIWAGETELMQVEGHGGFDCSGFVTRVFGLAGVPKSDIVPLNGRSSFTMSAVSGARRVYDTAKLAPGDVIFFGSGGASSSPGANFHAGMWMGNGWFIHSSGSNDGVTITHLSGWWKDRFSYGIRSLKKP